MLCGLLGQAEKAAQAKAACVQRFLIQGKANTLDELRTKLIKVKQVEGVLYKHTYINIYIYIYYFGLM